MFTLKRDNPFASSAPFHDDISLDDKAERGVGASKEVPSALGVSSAWGASGMMQPLVTSANEANRASEKIRGVFSCC